MVFLERIGRYVRWLAALLTSLCVSYSANYLFELKFHRSILPFFGSLSPTQEDLLSISIGTIFFLLLIYAFRNPISKYFFIYPALGRMAYSASLKFVYHSKIFYKNLQFSLIRNEIKKAIKIANNIELLLISGAEKERDPLEKFVLSQVAESKGSGKIITIFLLNPKSKYVRTRAKERFSSKETQLRYINDHPDHVAEIKKKYSAFANIILYDEEPIWRIFRIGQLMVISRYLPNQTADDGLTLGYTRPKEKGTPCEDNPYLSFLRYIKSLREKFDTELFPDDEIGRYIRTSINRVSNHQNNFCECLLCKIDLLKCFKARLAKIGYPTDRIPNKQDMIEMFELCFSDAFSTVYNNPHHSSYQLMN
jgi:hypothetical protein